MVGRALAALLACALACTGDGRRAAAPAEPGPDGWVVVPVLPHGYPEEGAPCLVTGEQTCRGGKFSRRGVFIEVAMLECIDDVWQMSQLCNDRCSAEQKCSAGCVVTRAGPSCLCSERVGSCSDDVPRCGHHGVLEVPDGETVQEVECHAFCRAQGTDGFTTGCGFDPQSGGSRCLCAALGEACVNDRASACVGVAVPPQGSAVLATQDISRCVAGTWTSVSCASECGSTGAQCHSEGDGSHGCECP